MNANESKNALSPIIYDISPGLTEIGKIKIGRKGETVQTGNNKTFQKPEKLDYFIITKLDRENNGNFTEDKQLIEKLKKLQGIQKLTRIPIVLLFNPVDLNLIGRYTCYTGRTRWCSGDGKKALRLSADKKGYDVVSCPCERKDPAYEGNDKCKVASCLSCVIKGADKIGGVWKFRSTSYNTYVGLLSTLTHLFQLTNGYLAGIDLDLVIYPKMGADPKTGDQRKIFVVGIEYNGSIENLRKTALQIATTSEVYKAEIKQVEQRALRFIETEVVEDNEKDFADEYYPEQAERDISGMIEEKQITVKTEIKSEPVTVEPEPVETVQPEPELTPEQPQEAPKPAKKYNLFGAN